MNYETLTKFITKHNSEICHITTWQTWKELNQDNLVILFDLIGRNLCSGMSNEELYEVYTSIWRYRPKYEKALSDDDEETLKELMKQL